MAANCSVAHHIAHSTIAANVHATVARTCCHGLQQGPAPLWIHKSSIMSRLALGTQQLAVSSIGSCSIRPSSAISPANANRDNHAKTRLSTAQNGRSSNGSNAV